MNRNYTELSTLKTFLKRFEYLKLDAYVGDATFGFDRYLNQALYHSTEWRRVRDKVILRDYGCDLGIPGHRLYTGLVVHHMNVITEEDILERNPRILEPEFLITTSHNTHMAIHYGNADKLPQPLIERRPGDTKLW